MDIDEKDSAMIALVENIQREQLSAIEESDAFIKLNQAYSMTHEEIAKYTGKSRSHVTNLIRLSELSKYCREMLMSKMIDMGHARAVLALGHSDQDKLIREVIAKKLSVRSVDSPAIALGCSFLIESKRNAYESLLISRTRRLIGSLMKRLLSQVPFVKTNCVIFG